ncbi:MAG: transcriptional repressor [Gammaproteobacteria bacterium]|nr:MAG: transcriptional repressor [Gammaproteobacteria bacterium]
MSHRATEDTSARAAWQARVRGHASAHDLLLTPIRQQVLDLLRQAFEPIGAYALRDRLEQVLARRVSPPTVYRALDYLQRGGLAARIESRNGWVACDLPDQKQTMLYCVCRACGSVVQGRDVDAHAALLALAGRRGFVARDCTLEVSGLCACCRAEEG